MLVAEARSREDRHANARRPLVGSGSVAAAARVEPSPKGLAQADTAVRVDPLDTNAFMRRLSASMGNTFCLSRERFVSTVQ